MTQRNNRLGEKAQGFTPSPNYKNEDSCGGQHRARASHGKGEWDPHRAHVGNEGSWIKGWRNWEAEGSPGMGWKRECRGIRDPNMRLWLQRVSGSAWSRRWQDGPQGIHRGKRRKMESSGVCKQLEMLSCKTWVHYLVDHSRNYERLTEIQTSKWIWL